jgi:hypothetical protein
MKKTIVFLMAFLIVAFSGFAQVSVKDARSMGMGGAFSAFSSGYASFYGNPAGFASAGSLTLVDTAAWTYFDPTPANLSKLQKMIGSSKAEVKGYLEEYLASNGLGGGAAVGLGWAGGGFALGAFVASENVAKGTTLATAQISSVNSANAVLGLGIPLIKSSWFELSVGGDVRPFMRVYSNDTGWALDAFLDPLLDGDDVYPLLQSQDATVGYGLAVDVGGMMRIGPLLFGVSMRDIASPFDEAFSKVGDLLAGKIPSGPYSKATISPKLTAGTGLRLRIVENTLESNLYAEIVDPIACVQGTKDPLLALHAGADLQILKFLTFRAGMNAGYLSYGFGIDLVILELDAALFTEELGVMPGAQGRTGISVQAAIRF